MANPNIDVWGAPSSWGDAQLWHAVTGSTEDKTSKPQTAIFDPTATRGRRGDLINGLNAGKFTQNVPIDKSVCPCGQDPSISCFGDIALFSNKQDEALNIIPDNVIEFGAPINWCMEEMRDYDGLFRNTHQCNRNNPKHVWSPDSDLSDYTNNNCYVSPYTYWALKSIYVRIVVDIITSYTDYFPNTTSISLKEWKTSYSDKKICRVAIYFYGYWGKSDNIIEYSTDQIMNMDENVGIVLLDDVDGVTDYATFLEDRRERFYLVSAQLYGNWYDQTSSFYMTGWNRFTGASMHAHSEQNTEHGWLIWLEIPYNENNYEMIMKMVACFGFPFSDSTKTNFNIDYLDEDLCLPIIDENGITHGEYTRGAANASNPLYSMSSIRDIDYDPSTPINPNRYSNVTEFNTIDTNAALSKFYVLDKNNVEKLGDDIWTICDSLSADDYDNFDGKIKDEFLTTNPIDCIISLKRFPFNIPHTFNPNKTLVQLGKSTGTAEGYRTFEIFFGINFKGIDIYPCFGNSFLDYSPYTKYELYIPFCGIVEINPGDILGHKLNVSLTIDLLTGSVVAYIKADQLVIGTANGSCGVDQVLSGTQSATVNSNIMNGIINAGAIDQSKMNQFGKMVYPTGWITTALNPFGVKENYNQLNAQQEKQEVDLQHIITPVHKMGAASPLLSWIQEFNARLLIYYPEGNVITATQPPKFNTSALESFGHLKGFATVTAGTVSSFQKPGKQCYLRGDILADNIPCTDNERKRIRSSFADGVFLPALTE